MTDTTRFDEAATTWDEQPRRVELARGVAEAIRRQVPLSGDLEVLDFGCGTGLVTLLLQPLVARITGADTSPGMLGELRRKVEAGGLRNVDTLLLDPAAPLRLDRPVDLVVSSMALHHVADLAPLFAGFRDALREGGRIALADLDVEDGSFHEDARGVHHHGLDRGHLVALLGREGFASLSVTTALVTRKADRDYPVFLVTGQRAAGA